MAKFNAPTVGSKTVNLAGGQAYKQTDKMEFISLLLTSFVQNEYYESQQGAMDRCASLIAGLKDKKFAAKAAVFARKEFGMRSITHVAAAEIARSVKGEAWTKDFISSVCYRPDDMLEIMALYLAQNGKPLPNSLKKGLAKAFDNFDDYQIAKYRGEGRDVSLIDLVNLVRPVPTDDNRTALKALVAGTLTAQGSTWESKLTAAGQTAKTDAEKTALKADAWKALLSENKLGYFAALKNINNIISQGDDETFDLLLGVLVNERMIKKSLVMPFRYMTALENLNGDAKRVRRAKTALNQALDISCNNIPKFDGDTLVVCDYSGSMGSGHNSRKGKGTLFGALLAKANDADFMIFGTSAAYLSYNPGDTALTIASNFSANNEYGNSRGITVGHGTSFNAIFDTVNKSYERIVIFSDMQGWVGHYAPTAKFNAYSKKYGKPKIYSFDLAGHGSMQFPEQDVFCIAGLSDKVFDIMKLLETDKQALVNKIEAVKL